MQCEILPPLYSVSFNSVACYLCCVEVFEFYRNLFAHLPLFLVLWGPL